MTKSQNKDSHNLPEVNSVSQVYSLAVKIHVNQGPGCSKHR